MLKGTVSRDFLHLFGIKNYTWLNCADTRNLNFESDYPRENEKFRQTFFVNILAKTKSFAKQFCLFLWGLSRVCFTKRKGLNTCDNVL